MAESAEPAGGGRRDELWRAADRASSWALQGQVTVQSRFGNFLLADSFLLLSWATVYTDGARTTGRVVVLAVLALTSVFLGAVFALLGSRYAKYDRLQWDLAAEAERRLPEELFSKLLVWAPTALCVTSLVLFAMSFLPR